MPVGRSDESGQRLTYPDLEVDSTLSIPDTPDVAGGGHLILADAMSPEQQPTAAPAESVLLGALVADGVEAAIERALGGLAALRTTRFLSDYIAEQMAAASHNACLSAAEPGDIAFGVLAVRQPSDRGQPIPIPGLVVPYGGETPYTVPMWDVRIDAPEEPPPSGFVSPPPERDPMRRVADRGPREIWGSSLSRPDWARMGPFRRARDPEPTHPLVRPPPDETWALLCRASRSLRALKASWGYRETDDIQVPAKDVRPIPVPPLGPPVGSMPLWSVPVSRPPRRPRPRRPPPPLAEAEALSEDEWAIRFAAYGMDFAGPSPAPVIPPPGMALEQVPGVENMATGPQTDTPVAPAATEAALPAPDKAGLAPEQAPGVERVATGPQIDIPEAPAAFFFQGL